MTSRRALTPLFLLAPAVAACSFSVSSGGPDYEKLESAIADELNASYEPIGRQVDSVDCPRLKDTPKSGDTFICKADLSGNPVRVQVTVTDDKNNVDFATMDTAYDLSNLSQQLAKEISADRGFAVTVTCGEGVKVVEAGKSFECTAADRRGDTRPVKVTAGGVDTSDRWELVGVDDE
ncbi:DUF4333 domain-containing protein [Mycolicibacterium brumae]|uniref:DUF4333 domain-containing protein n=1 Tax=Mycolicibacterium brumae TaxID=85968 RepID=UPI000A8FEA1A|nr:DUF4333 domain-containing protein [Mycolicibacterium brumae]MCV7193070.1 DUF4333 domain-containing protein [Mycolicibacterium brumae]UWW07928.1 DUF4333 domain-containing protein [Mycolicibacterium brumae]